jgi:WD40 repeat protein
MGDWPPLRDYGRSLAVLAGVWDYELLPAVPAAEHSLRRMERLLAGPLCGWPHDRLLVLPNVHSPGDLPDQLITAFEPVTDVAVFYFVGHGQLASDDQLCLGLARSRPEANRRAATSLRFADVRQALQDSSAEIKIVILDCCFAGLITARPALASDVLDLTAGTGAYTMAATSAYTTAWYEDAPGLAEPQTYFTKYLADLVEAGIPGQPSQLRLDPLFKQLRDNLAAGGRPVPHSRAVNDARDFVFAYNAAPPATHRDTEQELARLGQRLTETESMRAAADAQVSALKAEGADREQELARLRSLLARTAPHDTGQRQELQDAIDQAARRLDDNRAAQAALTAGIPPPARAPRRRRPMLIAVALACAVLAAAVAVPLALNRPGASHALTSPSRAGAKTPAKVTLGDLIATLPNFSSGGVDSVAFGPGGKILAAGDHYGSTYLWDIATKTIITTLADPHTSGVSSVAFGPGGKILAAGDGDGSTYLWDIATKTITTTLTDPRSALNSGRGVQAVAFSPDGQMLAAGDGDGSTYLWDIAAKRVTATLTDPGTYNPNAVAFSPDGKTLAVGSLNGGYAKTYLWDVTTGHLITTLNDPSAPGENYGVQAVAFSPDGKTLAAGDYIGNSDLWNLATRHVITPLNDPSGPGAYEVSGVAFSPDGKTLAVGGSKGRTYPWNVATGDLIATLNDSHTGAYGVSGVAFTPDGNTLAVGDSNGTIYLWSAD